MLALRAHVIGHQPDGRVIEEQRLDDGLQEIHEVVVTTDMRELVRDERLDLRRRQARDRGRRQQHDRLQPADHHGHDDHGRLIDTHDAIEREPSGDAAHERVDLRTDGPRRLPHQAAHRQPAAGEAERQQDHARAPDRENERDTGRARAGTRTRLAGWGRVTTRDPRIARTRAGAKGGRQIRRIRDRRLSEARDRRVRCRREVRGRRDRRSEHGAKGDDANRVARRSAESRQAHQPNGHEADERPLPQEVHERPRKDLRIRMKQQFHFFSRGASPRRPPRLARSRSFAGRSTSPCIARSACGFRGARPPTPAAR